MEEPCIKNPFGEGCDPTKNEAPRFVSWGWLGKGTGSITVFPPLRKVLVHALS